MKAISDKHSVKVKLTFNFISTESRDELIDLVY